jgi:transient receptor potential cation channel subfamily C member 4
MDAQTSGMTMNTESLLEFNPKLAEVSHTTRVAYAKFMTTKIKKEIKFDDDSRVTIENEKTRAKEAKAFNKFRERAGILKKTRQETEPQTSGNNTQHKVEITAPPASPSVEDQKDFRARTPIEEDPNEGFQTPDRPSTPENILDEPVPKIPSSNIPTPSPAPSPVPPENRKADSPIVKPRSLSIISESSAKSVETPTIKTSDLSKTEEEDEDVVPPVPSRKSSKDSLDVPKSSNRPVSPAPSTSINTGDKGKSKITGKTLTGWI